MKQTITKLTMLMLAGIFLLSAAGCTAATTTTAATVSPTSAIAANQPNVMPMRGGAAGSSTFTSVAPTYSDLAYATLSAAQKLDLYIPTTGSGPFPVVVMVHGGGFIMGDKADGTGLAGVDQLLAAGYAVASINYRLSGEATYPAQIFDAKAAVRFLRANAEKYKLNPDKFGAWGASAGGNLVSLLGTTCGVAELEGAELGNADQSSCVQAVVDWFGPIDFLKMQAQLTEAGCSASTDDASSPESKLIGAAIQTVPDLVAKSNPMNFITADDAPFFIENGTADCNIPPVQNKNLAEALSAVLGAEKVTYVSLDGAGHGGSQFEAAENLALVIAFLDKNLK
ncbi:MAG TPA: alpha/beta hydrolase [Anaerolineaceae bacterium]|nr:alpha/beta hydrolase [Anaerolineaceae bacterium]HPN53522.1 alpha/beta hydrolase [Anaerolineaceae bacterium]